MNALLRHRLFIALFGAAWGALAGGLIVGLVMLTRPEPAPYVWQGIAMMAVLGAGLSLMQNWKP